MSTPTNEELKARLDKLQAINGQEVGGRAGDVARLIEELLAVRKERDELKFSPGATKVGVMAIIRDAQGQILLGKKSRAVSEEFVGKFVAPGGRVNYGETLEAACIRECYEETGLIVEVVAKLPVQEIVAEKWHFVFPTFECRIVGGEAKAGDDLCELGWFSADALPEVTPITRAGIQDALKASPSTPATPAD